MYGLWGVYTRHIRSEKVTVSFIEGPEFSTSTLITATTEKSLVPLATRQLYHEEDEQTRRQGYTTATRKSWFPEFAQHRVYRIECGINLLSDLVNQSQRHARNHTWQITYLCARKHNLTRDEDEEHDLRLDHAIDETREQLYNIHASATR